MAKRTCIVLLLSLLVWTSVPADDTKPPIRLAIVGLVHDHVYGFMPLLRGRKDVQLVGIVESDKTLVAKCAQRYGLNSNLFFSNLDELFAKTEVQAVSTFTTTFDHRRVVEACAAHHVDVMMEKPLAVSVEHARAIKAAATRGGIQIIVNYETTWYPGNEAAYRMVDDEHAIGDLRKIVVRDGHRGPKEIGCSATFVNWLSDPVLNGGGALMDFGCYGADLITWLMHGERPVSVMAVTQQIKPDVYPKVEDEATIILTYPHTQGIIQASWNWPMNRKDMEIYGQTGCVLIPQKDTLRIRKGDGAETEQKVDAAMVPELPKNQLSYLVSVERKEIVPSGLSSLDLNLIVTEILEAAKKSAKTGRRVELAKNNLVK